MYKDWRINLSESDRSNHGHPIASTERQVPILSTKLYRPPITVDYVLREELEARLDAGVELPLTVVSAPAGYGKSTLVSHWMENCSLPGAWLSLDDPDERMILVLDDYHRIRMPDIHSLLDRLLAHPPRGLHLVIVSRHDPSLSLASLRARHMLHEFRMRELQFSIEETRSFLNRAVKHSVSQDVANQLQNSTEGWPVGIRLAALALQHLDDDSSFLSDFGADARPLQQYLVGEVLSGQPTGVRDCLVSSSILGRFNAPLCDAVWGDDCEKGTNPIKGKEFIATLDNSGLFCVALDGQRRWFRFHHLFRDLLRLQLEETRSKEEISALHHRASRWFAKNDDFEEAIQHALAGGDYKGAALIVGEARHDLMNRDQWQRLERWLKLFRDDTVDAQIHLLLLRCWLGLNHWYRLDLLVRDLSKADKLLENTKMDSTVADSLKAEVASMRSGLAYWMLNPTDCIALARQTLHDSSADQECVQSTAIMMQGGAHQGSCAMK